MTAASTKNFINWKTPQMWILWKNKQNYSNKITLTQKTYDM